MTIPASPFPADVLVVGDGLIGLASAVALGDAGCRVTLLGSAEPGQASHAAAGMLAPGVERATGAAHRFALLARDRFPGYVEELAERTGIAVPLNRRGILQVALEAALARELHAALPPGAEWLEPRELEAEEPALGHAAGAILHLHDGAVDNRRLLAALAALVARHPRVRRVEGRATALSARGAEEARLTVRTAEGRTLEADRVVLAAGAWAPRIAGLPRPLPVAPVRGQMLALGATPLRHVVYGPGGYLVPRRDRTLVGSTMEHVAFDSSTTAAGLAQLRGAGTRLCPALAGAPELERWAGIRPITPDGLPILGPDPDAPGLVYACGHSRNGILLAPLTGDCVAAVVTGRPTPAPLAPFAIERFSVASGA